MDLDLRIGDLDLAVAGLVTSLGRTLGRYVVCLASGFKTFGCNSCIVTLDLRRKLSTISVKNGAS